MRTCPKCNELNGDNRTECWKCKASISSVNTYKKICPKCGLIFSQKDENCDKCYGKLSVYDERYKYMNDSADNGGIWMYVVAILIPLAGIILGGIYIFKGDEELGKSLIKTSIVTFIVAIMLGVLLAFCSLI